MNLKEVNGMQRTICALMVFVAVFFVGSIVSAGELMLKNEIIEKLGGASVTEEVPIAATRGYRGADKSIKVEQKSRNVAVIPKHVVVRLLFKINSTEFADHRSDQQLAQIGLALSSTELAHIKVEIAGHTCDLGTDEHNLKLSQARAERVKSNLEQYYKIYPKRLMAIGYGERYPHALNDSEVNRKFNRRVVIKRIE